MFLISSKNKLPFLSPISFGLLDFKPKLKTVTLFMICLKIFTANTKSTFRLLLCLGLCLSFIATANSQSFQTKFYTAGKNFVPRSIDKTSNDSLSFVVGRSYNDSSGKSELWVSCLDTSFNIIWSKSWENRLNGELIDVDVFKNDSFIIVAGHSDFSKGSNQSNFVIGKLDISGNLIWLNTYHGANKDYAEEITILKNGDIIIAGYSNNIGYSLLFRVDAMGGLIWSKKLNVNANDNIHKVLEDNNGNLFIIGTAYKAYNDDDILIAKITPNGKLIWSKLLGNVDRFDKAEDAKFMEDSSHIVICGLHEDSSNEIDGFMMKMDTAGNVVWSKTYGTSKRDWLFDLDVIGDSNICVAGYSDINSSTTGGDVFWLNTDKNGTLLNSAITLKPGTDSPLDVKYINGNPMIINTSFISNNSGLVIRNADPVFLATCDDQAMPLSTRDVSLDDTVMLSISNFFVTTNGILPTSRNVAIEDSVICSDFLAVDFIDVSVLNKNCVNHIEWITSTEIDVERFEIQKSFDGFNFSTIGTSLTDGLNSSIEKHYVYTDRCTVPKNYYRIKEIDYNRKSVISKVVSASCNLRNCDIVEVEIVNNTLVISGKPQNDAFFRLYDLTGKLILKEKINNEYVIPELPLGVYFANVLSNGKIYNLKYANY